MIELQLDGQRINKMKRVQHVPVKYIYWDGKYFHAS